MPLPVSVDYVPNMYYPFFTDDVWVAIQDGSLSLNDAWISYEPYHNDYERINRSNQCYIFAKFKEKYNEILNGPKKIKILPTFEDALLYL